MDIIILTIAIVITFGAQFYVTTNYNKYKSVKTKKGLTGFEVARIILDNHNLNDVYVTEIKGYLSDHYDASRRVVRLSSEVFHGNSIASCSIAAHEVGHAIQDKENFKFMQFRSLIFPYVSFVSYFGYFAILLGMLFGSLQIISIGISSEIIILLFQTITLPIEYDASKRAFNDLSINSLLNKKELEKCKVMLNSAALTYVASVINTILQIFRLLLIFGNSKRK